MTTSTVSHRARTGVFARAVAGLFLFGISTAAAQAATCGSPIEPGQYGLSFQSGGVEREAVYVIPSSYTGKKKVPLVLDFHGSNSNPKVQLGRSHWNEVAEREGFVVMALAGSLKGELPNTHAWNVPGVTAGEGADESAAIRELLKLAKDTLCIDASKVYASGYSGGGRTMIEAYEKGEAPAYEAYALTLNHKHIPEIMACTGLKRRPLFIPAVGNFPQGMLVQIPLHLDMLPGAPTAAKLHDALAAHYAGSEWVTVEPATESGKLDALALKDTNKMELRVFGNAAHGHAVLIARLDNLGKGASGAAVQNLQLMLGL